MARPFHSVCVRASSNPPPKGPPRAGPGMSTDAGLEGPCRRAGVQYYGNCEVTVWRNNFHPQKQASLLCITLFCL